MSESAVTDTTPFAFATEGRSDVGLVRHRNEDAWLARPELGLWAVADGMGGHLDGRFASGLIVQALAALPASADAPGLVRAVQQALAGCHAALHEHAGPHDVCGSTVVVLLVADRHFACLWAGDSRLYRLRGDALEQLNHDHSMVGELVAEGVLPREQVRHHPLRNTITRALGVPGPLELDALQGPVEPGDLFILCSDGLWDELDDAEMAAIIGDKPLPVAADGLLAAALERGGRDNVTLVLVRCAAADPLGVPDAGVATEPAGAASPPRAGPDELEITIPRGRPG